MINEFFHQSRIITLRSYTHTFKKNDEKYLNLSERHNCRFNLFWTGENRMHFDWTEFLGIAQVFPLSKNQIILILIFIMIMLNKAMFMFLFEAKKSTNFIISFSILHVCFFGLRLRTPIFLFVVFMYFSYLCKLHK